MGSYLMSVISNLSKLEARILLLGLDNAGKTTILHQMKFNECVPTMPTIGFGVETIEFKGLKLTVWDIGGQTTIRNLWHYYIQGSEALIYVLDSSDEERFDEAKKWMDNMLAHEEFKNAPVLVFANKMDVSRVKLTEIAEKLGMHKLKSNPWHLQPCCGLNGEGLY